MVSSMGETSMSWWASTFMSYLMFWPIFNTEGSSNSGFKSLIAFFIGIWSGASPACAEPGLRFGEGRPPFSSPSRSSAPCAAGCLWASGM